MRTTDPDLQAAYRHCLRIARRHYENFPVASLLLPRRLRPAVAAIYAFARTADDYADEGRMDGATRLTKLDEMERGLDAIQAGKTPGEPLFQALGHAVRAHGLPVEYFRQLLSAFRMDVTKKRYENFGELMEYCRHSANPVGRLMLHLFDAVNARNTGCSDALCSALQLINFLQDLERDYRERGRIYIPADEMARFGVSEIHFRERRSDEAMKRLLSFQIERTKRLLQAGRPLGRTLKGRIGLEMRLILAGGERVLHRLKARERDLFARPRLTNGDRVWMMWRAIGDCGIVKSVTDANPH